MTEHIVEMDAMDVAEWEMDRLTPLAPDAKLAALVKESAEAPAVPRNKTVARAPSPPPVKSGPIPRVTPVSMAAVAPPTPPARTTARVVAKKPADQAAPAAQVASTKPAAPAARPATPPAAGATRITSFGAPLSNAAAPAAKAPVPAQAAPSGAKPLAQAAPAQKSSLPTQAKRARKPTAVKVKRPAAIVEDDLAISVAAQTPIPVAGPIVPTPVPVAAVHTPVPERLAVAAVHTPVPERLAVAARQPDRVEAPIAVAAEPIVAPAPESPPARMRATSVDDDWFGEGTQAAAPLMVEPAPLPPAPEPMRAVEPVPAVEPMPAPVPIPEPVRTLPVRIETENPEYDWTPRPGTAPGPDAIVPSAFEERTRATDSIPAVTARRSRRPFVILASAASVIAIVAILALSGGSGSSTNATAAAAVDSHPTPAPPVATSHVAAPAVTTPEPAVAVAIATPEPAPVVAPAPVKPIATKRIARAKKLVLEYDHPTAPAEPANDDAAVARARGAYTSGNQRLFAGDPDGALHFYRQALAFYPGYVAGYRGLGLAFAQQGDKVNALKALRTYVAAVPNAKDVALINARIARLAK